MLDVLTDNTWHNVTIEFLDLVKREINKDEVRLRSYEDAFKVLRYLEEHKVIELKQTDDYFQLKKK